MSSAQVFIVSHRDFDPAFIRRVFNGVPDKAFHDLFQGVDGDSDGRRRVGMDHHLDSTVIAERVKFLQFVAHELIQAYIHRLGILRSEKRIDALPDFLDNGVPPVSSSKSSSISSAH
jgi:hypothetical protein